jgi:uncharacterized protein YkwD
VLLPTGKLDHQNLGSILVAANGRLEEVGENLFLGAGAGATDAGSAHLTLMESAEHRANMLLPQGQLVGIGAACGDGRLVVVEDFGITTGAPLPPSGQAVPPEYPIVSTNPGGAHC